MDTKLLIIFIVLNIANVIIQTVKTLATVKCGKTISALVNAIAYGLYTIVLVYTVCDLPLMLKAGIVALCNLIGVYVVKSFEEKLRRDRLWKVELTIKTETTEKMHNELDGFNIPHSYVTAGKYTIFNCYCSTQKDSTFTKEIAIRNKAKFFASEAKEL